MAKAPFDIVNEQAILASMLNCPQCRRRAMHSLSSEDFHGVRHRVLFMSISSCELNGVEPDKANVAVHAEEEQFGGLEYVDKLIGMGIAKGFEVNLERIRKEASRRRALEKLPALEEILEDREQDHTAHVEAASAVVRELRDIGARTSTHGTSVQWLDEFEQRCDGNIPFVPTGYTSLDTHLVEGLAHRRITVIGGRPGSGKSTMLVDLVRRQLEMKKKPRILVLPLESGKIRFLDMLVSSSTGIDAERIIKSPDTLSLEERERIRHVVKKLVGTDDRLEVMDNPFVQLGDKWTNDSALDRLEEMLADGGYDQVAIDLFQRMLADWSTQRINSALARAQSMFQRYETHGIFLTQISRKAEDRSKDRARRPTLGDLKDAGMYEESADIAILLHRERMYKPNMREDYIEAQIAKQKLGEAGFTMVSDFEPWIFRLTNDEVRDIDDTSSFVSGEGGPF